MRLSIVTTSLLCLNELVAQGSEAPQVDPEDRRAADVDHEEQNRHCGGAEYPWESAP